MTQLEIGDWVATINDQDIKFVGFVTKLTLDNVYVFFLTASDNTAEQLHCNKIWTMDYVDLIPLDVKLNKEEIKALIDLALDLKDEEMFMIWSNHLIKQ